MKRIVSGTAFIVILIATWEIVIRAGVLPRSVYPTPTDIVTAIPLVIPRLAEYFPQTLIESLSGYLLSAVIAFVTATLMDRFTIVKNCLHPIVTLMQTIPIFAIAPLFVLWFGFGITAKIVVVVLTCSFPMIIGLYNGLISVESNMLDFTKTAGANYPQTFWYVKLPLSVPNLFSGLRIASTYCVVGAVLGEWVGGDGGLGTLMIKYRNNYMYDRMFVVIGIVCILSLLLCMAVDALHRHLNKYILM